MDSRFTEAAQLLDYGFSLIKKSPLLIRRRLRKQVPFGAGIQSAVKKLPSSQHSFQCLWPQAACRFTRVTSTIFIICPALRASFMSSSISSLFVTASFASSPCTICHDCTTQIENRLRFPFLFIKINGEIDV